MRFAIMAATLVLAGCAAPSPIETTAAPHEEPLVANEPILEKGLALTFRYREQRSPVGEGEVTVIVAEAGPEGYLFAVSSEEELLIAGLSDAPWFGSAYMNLSEAARPRPILEFPLTEGKTWKYREGTTFTAHEQEIDVAGYTERGFVITGGDDEHNWTIHYSPALGYITRYVEVEDGLLGHSIDLIRTGTADRAIWMEELAQASASMAAPATVFDVPPESTMILVGARAVTGAQVSFDRPVGIGGHGWSKTGSDTDPWGKATLPPVAGEWLLTASGPPKGAMIRVSAIKIIEKAL